MHCFLINLKKKMATLSHSNSKMWDFINDCVSLHDISLSACKKLISFLEYESINYEMLHDIELETKSIPKLYSQMVQTDVAISSQIFSETKYDLRNYNYHTWLGRCKCQCDDLVYCMRAVILRLLSNFEDRILVIYCLRLISMYNDLVDLNISENVDIVFANSSSSLTIQNKKKFSVRRILKLAALQRSEECATLLSDLLLKQFNDMNLVSELDDNALVLGDNNQTQSDNISIVILNTLTKDISPPRRISPDTMHHEHNKNQTPGVLLAQIATNEQRKLLSFFSAVTTESTGLLHETDVKPSQISGELKLRSRVRSEMMEYYERVLWQNVGLIGEHTLLWWLPLSLGRKNVFLLHKFLSWLKEFQKNEQMPAILKPTIAVLIDCLHSHVTSTSWDELFRQAYISVSHSNSRQIVQNIGLGTFTGHLLCDLLHDSVFLTNCCEDYSHEIENHENLPIAEQIQALHRLDHSVHMTRLWSLGRAKYLSNCWNMDQFFRVTHVDVNASLYALSQLKLATNLQSSSGMETPHFAVCSKMRMKLISEVKTNIEKLNNVPGQSLSILASVCKITCLAYLRISFPDSYYWQQCPLPESPRNLSEYVYKYLDEILEPVLAASMNLTLPVQKSVSRLVLRILCEAWLDHIYKFRIKFSEWGAVQLLADFAGVSKWIQSTGVSVCDDTRNFLMCSEILRQCEGVGRLLLRSPGELIMMNNENPASSDAESKDEIIENLMPPEMYVPNQEQWLQLRSNKRTVLNTVCCTAFLIKK